MSGALKVVIYRSEFNYAASAVADAIDHQDLLFTTMYPGGRFGVCSFFVPINPDMPHQFKAGYRVGIFDNLDMVWEGQIDVLTYVSTSTKRGLKVDCTGYWGTILKRRRFDRVWCDTRMSQDVWELTIDSTTQQDKFNLARPNAIRFSPVETDFLENDDIKLVYTMPTGQTVDRISANYEMYEGTQAWVMSFLDYTTPPGTVFATITSSGTSTLYGTPDTGCTSLALKFYSAASQTANYDDDIYGQISNLKVYGISGTITATNIVEDIQAKITTLSTDQSWIGDNSQVIEPAFMEGETVADYLSKIAAFGDTSLNPWAAGVVISKESLTPDYKPLLYYKEQLPLTSYEYKLSIDEMEGGCNIEAAYDEIANWIMIEYTDVNDNRVIVTPDDDSDLKDDTSIAEFGQRDVILRLGSVGVTEAKIYARRYLAWYKDLHYRLTTPIVVKGFIRGTGVGLTPVFKVQAGFRVMIDDFLQEANGSGIIFLITATRYDERTDTMTIYAGTPNPLETLAARQRY